ncbi:MAG TPA: peptide ABC transporter substrate-binding protein [Thermomicrobiales bacterium]|nr:peptide ABC transporter substrate-binding protein [Thermomicrobiales bacterium]
MIPIDREQVRLLEQRLRGVGVDRRTFLKVAGAALAAPAAGTLLAACGDDDPTATSAPAPAATATSPGQAPEPTATDAPAATAEPGAPTNTPAPVAATNTPAPAATATAAPEPAEQQLLRVIGTRAEPSSHDFNADLYAGGAATIWAGVLSYNENFEPIPDWATEWEPNEDATTWTFRIRPDNGGFSNGDDVTAETFAYSWRRLLTPATAAPYASILFDILGSEDINLQGADPMTLGVRAVDDWTLEVDMIGPRGLFPVIAGYVACFPTHPPSVEAGNYSTDPADGEVISNGPFLITEWRHDQYCKLVKNPNFWEADRIRIEEIDWLIIPAEQGMLPYEADEVDYASVPGADYPRVVADPVYSQEIEKYVDPLIWKILPQVTVEPFDDIWARRALSHSIDRDRINELTNFGGDPAYSLMPPGLFGYLSDDEEIRDIQAFDLARAEEALAQSRYADRNWPEVTIILRNEAHLNSTIMVEDVAAQVEENLGLRMDIQVMDVQAFRELQFTLTPQIVWIRWFYDYPDPNNGYFDMFYSVKETGRRQAWSNAEFDALTIAGKEEPDPAARLEIYRQCEIIMQTEVGYIPVVYRNAYYVYKPWLKGIPINRQGFVTPSVNIYINMWREVYIEGRDA